MVFIPRWERSNFVRPDDRASAAGSDGQYAVACVSSGARRRVNRSGISPTSDQRRCGGEFRLLRRIFGGRRTTARASMRAGINGGPMRDPDPGAFPALAETSPGSGSRRSRRTTRPHRAVPTAPREAWVGGPARASRHAGPPSWIADAHPTPASTQVVPPYRRVAPLASTDRTASSRCPPDERPWRASGDHRSSLPTSPPSPPLLSTHDRDSMVTLDMRISSHQIGR